MRSSVITFKTKAGIFNNDKYVPLIEAVINLGSSIILVKYFGLAGIFMGTTISTITLPLWIQSKLVYNNVFNKSVNQYFKKYFLYLGLTIIIGLLTTVLSNIITITGIIGLVFKGVICVTVPNIILVLIFYRTDEFKYILNIIKNILRYKKNIRNNNSKVLDI